MNIGDDPPRELNLDQASAQLNEGLKACRSMVDNYRAILSRSPSPDNDDELSIEPMSGGPSDLQE